MIPVSCWILAPNSCSLVTDSNTAISVAEAATTVSVTTFSTGEVTTSGTATAFFLLEEAFLTGAESEAVLVGVGVGVEVEVLGARAITDIQYRDLIF